MGYPQIKLEFNSANDAIGYLERMAEEAGDLYRDIERSEQHRWAVDHAKSIDAKALQAYLEEAREQPIDPAYVLEQELYDLLVALQTDVGALHPGADWELEFPEFVELLKRYEHASCLDMAKAGDFTNFLGISSQMVEQLLQSEYSEQIERISAAAVLFGIRRLRYVLESIISSMHSSHRVSRQIILDALNTYPLHTVRATIAWNHLSIHVCDIPGVVDRALRLAEVALGSAPSEVVPQYMKLLHRNYLLGHYVECEIICRSVLETAIKAAFRRARLNGESSMNARIVLAERRGWISRDQAVAARRIWYRGNRVIHETPTGGQDPADRIVGLLQIVDALEKVGEHPR